MANSIVSRLSEGAHIQRRSLANLSAISHSLNSAATRGLVFGVRENRNIEVVGRWSPQIIRNLCLGLNINVVRFQAAFSQLPETLATTNIRGSFAVDAVVNAFDPSRSLSETLRYINRPSRIDTKGAFLPPEEQMAIIERGVAGVEPRSEMLAKLAEQRPLNIKLGVDPTSPDIHLGHTVVFKKLRDFQDLGHSVVFLIGDLTATIGDPTGRSQTRKPLTRADVLRNAQTYLDQVSRLLDVDRTQVVFNSSWLNELTFTDVLSLASTYTVARIMDRKDFTKRYSENAPISFSEFMYPFMQAYDSVAIEADVELGGTDQLFNLAFGRDIQKAVGQSQQIFITLPILPGLDGKEKMSKSLGNQIGITDSPDDMFGKLMSISDELIRPYAELLTNLPLQEIDGIHPMEAKKMVAEAIVASMHSQSEAQAARASFDARFSRREVPTDMPSFTVPLASLSDGKIGIIDLLVFTGMAESRGKARSLVTQGAVRILDEKVTDFSAQIDLTNEVILKVGKLRYAKVGREA